MRLGRILFSHFLFLFSNSPGKFSNAFSFTIQFNLNLVKIEGEAGGSCEAGRGLKEGVVKLKETGRIKDKI